MRIERGNFSNQKGWYTDPWNSDVAISVGYANVVKFYWIGCTDISLDRF